MRRFLLLTILVASFFTSKSQNLSYTCPRDTVLGCNSACFALTARFPDPRALGTDYTFKEVTPISVCRPYVPPDVPGPSTNLVIDDRYSTVIPIGFNFPFYGTTYTSLVASTNGYLSFDISLATLFAAWQLDGGNVPSVDYDGALIMGPWHDLDPSVSTSPTQQIKYNLVGTAPTRKWVLSFYKVPQFQCNALIENTHQIVLHESTGVIEVFIFDKEVCAGWNSGKSMVGLQDITKTKGIFPPGRGADDPSWGTIGMDEVWRFIPTGGAPLYRSVELLDGTGAVVAVGDTTRIDANTFETTFPNVCPPAGASIYVVKTTYAKLDDLTSTIYSLDTINVTRQAALPVSATMTPTTCGGNTGTVTVTIGGGGTPPYQYSIDGGPLQASNVFTGVSGGLHTVYAEDATGCNNTFDITVTSISALPATIVKTNASCPGVNNGTITVTPTAGVAPFQYSIDGGPSQASNVFSNLGPGTYAISFTDANSCTSAPISVTITAGAALTSTAVTIGSACPGADNGSTTITPTSGTAPYTYSIDGGPNQASNIFTGLTPGNHTVSFTDANGCSGTRTVFISTGAGITSTQTNTPTSCPGVDNGTVTITPTNGTAPYTYSADGGPFQASNTLTGLTPTLHTITIQDANSCTGTIVVAITTGAGISGSATSTASSCPGATNGTITVTPSSGTAPYTYSLDGGAFQASNVFNAVTSGPHTIAFQDANGCTGTTAANVATGAGIAGTAASTAAACPGASNGTITVTPTTGVAPYTYSLDGGAFQASNIFNAVASGPHTVTIRDVNGCTGTAATNVGAGVAITGGASSTATSCPAVNNGTVTVTPATGTAPYTYSIDGGAFQAGNTFNGLAAGSHTATFQDINGCIGTATVTVAAGSNLTGTVSSTATSCPTVSNGTVTVTPTSGSAPYTFSSDGGATFQPSNIFSGLAPGPHLIIIRDALGCTGNVNTTVAQGIAITGTATATGTSCPGVDNGTVTVTPTTGTAPYTYSIDGGAFQAGNVFTGLAAGSHTATFQDAVGCPGTATVTVTAGTGLTSTQLVIGTSCPGVNNGSITVTPTSGTIPYQYSIDGGASQASNIFNGLTSGSHTIIITDALGCTGTVIRTVPGGVNLVSTVALSNPPCSNINDGSITITPTSGVAPYQYSLNGGPAQAGNSFTGLSAGIPYTITFTDAIGCVGTKLATLTTNTPITTTVTKTMPLCNGNANGSIRLTPSGGVPAYEYSIDGGATYQANNTFTALIAGTYTFRIRDNAGCIKDTTVTLAEPPVLTASTLSTVGTCNGNDGLITITAAGGTAAYQYSIDNGVTYQASNTFVVSGGPYPNIRVKDANGCIANTSAIVTLIDNMIPLALGPDSTICVGSSVTFQPQTGPETNIFSWTSEDITIPIPVGTIDSDTIKNATVTPTDTFSYVLTAHWGVCFRKDTIVINVLHKPIANAGLDSAICFDQTVAILQGSASNVSGPVLYSWSPTTGVQNPDTSYTFITLDTTTEFTLTVSDDYGCGFVVTDKVLMGVQPPVPAFAGNDTIGIRLQPHQLLGSGGTGYEWTPTYPFGASSPFIANPLAILDHNQQFVVKVTDFAGCIGYDTVFVQVYDGPGYYVPNAFSPNGDGLNDVFRAIPVGITRTDWFRVFNRYGEMIFETNQWLKGWDGTFKGKKQPVGNYVWILKGINKYGRVVEMKGTVLIVQ